MPVIKSAKKALRQSFRRKQRNLKRKEAVKDLVKKIKKLAAEGKTEEAKALISKAYKAIDKAAKSYLHKRAAARKKSRLLRYINKYAASGQQTSQGGAAKTDERQGDAGQGYQSA